MPRAHALQQEKSPQWEARALEGRVDPTQCMVRKPPAKQPKASKAKKKKKKDCAALGTSLVVSG